MNRIALGTAQFGMAYGINNQRGKIPSEEALEILNEAAKSGIDILDTAYGYCDAEIVLGQFIQSSGKNFKVISKLPSCGYGEVEKALSDSLRRLGSSSIYGYLVHNFESYKKEPRIWQELEMMKRSKKIEKIGFSLYRTSELELLMEREIKIDLINVPHSVFDQRFGPYFKYLKNMGVEIYTRSVFLQGLVFKKADQLSAYFNPIKEKVDRLHQLARETGLSIATLCINFVLLNDFVDEVVVGVDRLENLKEIMAALRFYDKTRELIDDLLKLREDDESLILPFNWT